MIIYSTPELIEAASKAGWPPNFCTEDLVVVGGLTLWKTETYKNILKSDNHLPLWRGWELKNYPPLLEYIEKHYPEALL